MSENHAVPRVTQGMWKLLDEAQELLDRGEQARLAREEARRREREFNRAHRLNGTPQEKMANATGLDTAPPVTAEPQSE